MPNPSQPPSVFRIAAFTLIGAAIGFYIQDEIERDYKDKQLAAYEDYLERRAKTKK